MKSVIPYKKVIEFKTKIAEICSISLEHEYEVNEGELKGEFIVSGDYRIHEVSINKEVFNYRLPFEVNLPDNIVKDSINFQILDFTYDIVDGDKLSVDIEFGVEALDKEEERNDELDSLIKELEEVRENKEDEIEENIENEEEVDDENLEEERKGIVLDNAVDVVGEDETVTSEEATKILDSNKENTYITYHIHIVKESESIEGIANLYGTSRTVLEEYNDLNNLVVGDKLIIPIAEDE